MENQFLVLGMWTISECITNNGHLLLCNTSWKFSLNQLLGDSSPHSDFWTLRLRPFGDPLPHSGFRTFRLQPLDDLSPYSGFRTPRLRPLNDPLPHSGSWILGFSHLMICGSTRVSEPSGFGHWRSIVLFGFSNPQALATRWSLPHLVFQTHPGSTPLILKMVCVYKLTTFFELGSGGQVPLFQTSVRVRY